MIQLTPRDLSRIAEIHELRRRAELEPISDERVMRQALTEGLIKERDELRRLAEAFEKPESNLARRQAC